MGRDNSSFFICVHLCPICGQCFLRSNTIPPSMTTATIPISITDPINARILAISEDKLQGFQADPIGEIARQSGVDDATVIERIQAMLRAGTIRRVRQTLMATNL